MIEESVVVPGDDEHEDDTRQNCTRRKLNQNKGFSSYKPSNHKRKKHLKTPKRCVEDGLEMEDTIRKEVVSVATFFLQT